MFATTVMHAWFCRHCQVVKKTREGTGRGAGNATLWSAKTALYHFPSIGGSENYACWKIVIVEIAHFYAFLHAKMVSWYKVTNRPIRGLFFLTEQLILSCENLVLQKTGTGFKPWLKCIRLLQVKNIKFENLLGGNGRPTNPFHIIPLPLRKFWIRYRYERYNSNKYGPSSY